MKKIIWKVIKIAGLAYLGFSSFAYERCERLIRMLDGYCVGINDETYSECLGNRGFCDQYKIFLYMIVKLHEHKWNVEKTFRDIVKEYEEYNNVSDEES